MKEIQPPKPISLEDTIMSVFLAGSIEMNTAEDWQKKVISTLENEDITILNPRRDDWDGSWGQTLEDKNFLEQVTWELDAQDDCDVIIMYFDPNTKSPITLLELGLYAESGKLVVCCPEGYWRKGNVDVVCKRYGITQTKTLDELIEYVKHIYTVRQSWDSL